MPARAGARANGVLLVVALALDHPFAGDVSVDPAPLERVLVDFGRPPA
jgi:hypothetical protein